MCTTNGTNVRELHSVLVEHTVLLELVCRSNPCVLCVLHVALRHLRSRSRNPIRVNSSSSGNGLARVIGFVEPSPPPPPTDTCVGGFFREGGRGVKKA